MTQHTDGLTGYVGKNVFVRTVTFHYTGRLVSADSTWLVLEDAAWIADSGRWANALADGTLAEIEPFPGEVLIAAGSVVDISSWTHDLPRKQK